MKGGGSHECCCRIFERCSCPAAAEIQGFGDIPSLWVRTQLDSLLRHWEDHSFRNTILLLGLEEGTFYEPPRKLEIRCFVVVTIRNSPIETIQSEAYAQAGLSASLPGAAIREITSEAIRYFNRQDFGALCPQAKTSSRKDIYGELQMRHPIFWSALNHLARASAKTVDFPWISCPEPFPLAGIEPGSGLGPAEINPVCLDAFDPVIDPQLSHLLHYLTSNSGNSLILDSFKALTRSAEKLFDGMEFLLSRECSVATSNSYLENGHAERCVKPLRAGHTAAEIRRNLTQISGLGYRHQAALRQYLTDSDKIDS